MSGGSCKNMCKEYPEVFKSTRLSEKEGGKRIEFNKMVQESLAVGAISPSWLYREDIAYCSTCAIRFRTDESYLHKCMEISLALPFQQFRALLFWRNRCFCCKMSLRRKKGGHKKESEVKRI